MGNELQSYHRQTDERTDWQPTNTKKQESLPQPTHSSLTDRQKTTGMIDEAVAKRNKSNVIGNTKSTQIRLKRFQKISRLVKISTSAIVDRG